VGPEAGFTPAVTQRATFQAPPDAAEERGGPAGGTSVPSAMNKKCWVEPEAGFTPAVTQRATFQAPPDVAEERGGSAGGPLSPPR